MFTSSIGVNEHPSGRARWTKPDGSVIEITRLPLFDNTNGVFARLTYAQALVAARTLGGRLLHRDEVEDTWKRGFRTAPVTLWKPGTGAEMMSLDWARDHDAKVLRQLIGWDGTTPVASVGKDYLEGAPRGRQRYFGWIDENGRPIQNDTTTQHSDDYSDYSQLTRIAWDISGPTKGGGGTVKPLPGKLPTPPSSGGSTAAPDEDEGGIGGGTMLLLLAGLVVGGMLLLNVVES